MDALRTYRRPAFVYLPPGAELRGGAWVVIDSAINPNQVSVGASPMLSKKTPCQHPGLFAACRCWQDLVFCHRSCGVWHAQNSLVG